MLLLPIGQTVYYSFTNYTILNSPSWIGLDNYGSLLHDQFFQSAVANTAYLMLVGVPARSVAVLKTKVLSCAGVGNAPACVWA